MLLDSDYTAALLALMRIDTVTPMEDGDGALHASANQAYAALAEGLGMRVVFAGAGCLPEQADAVVPTTIARRMAEQADFLQRQPHLVLELGRGDAEHTLMFNFHMDCVGPHLPASLDCGVLRGRGAVDNKGPGVAVLAALAAVRRQCPQIFDSTRVLVMAVAGEEGGAMGVYGTRHLIERGFVGRLNVFVEPSDGAYFDASTTSMTWEARVDGQGSTDDFPDQGQNATLMLAFLAQHMAAVLSPRMVALGVKMTLAGLHTGHQHNRVYGEGRLLFNFAYADAAGAQAARAAVEAAFDGGLAAFADRFGARPPFVRSAASVREVCHASWIKCGLPVLNNRHGELESVLASVGLLRNTNINEAFTCDAMWAQRPGAYSIVFGPGSLARNGAHTAAEHVAIAELEAFAVATARLIVAFAHGHSPLPAAILDHFNPEKT
ncbi:M20/M25/M40 family metallo-hydrolase [Rugamonas sp. CCM 8940]|uniref:M20/M25/M40 family metallo-hydrolase n=1 Tax=Rugamonas sp. CCM 8940 TaxID=2765359 RepID=UPI0018F3EDC3|nr:M20/M25/M40 family metallo-hydrolase [Rugamonas sp. CCM 8940]MBJ7311269.1 M20/M25/M40 family metallo-hydrolase [Rugamonas sp. CCM 8940]